MSVLQVGGTYLASRDDAAATPLVPWAWRLLAASGATLAFKNRKGISVLVVVQAATIAYYVLGFPADGPVFVALAVALVNAVLRGYGRWPWLLYTIGLLVRFALMWVIQDEMPALNSQLGQAAWGYLLLAGATVFRYRADRFAEIRQRQQESRRREVSEERLRIARELHDVLAHNVPDQRAGEHGSASHRCRARAAPRPRWRPSRRRAGRRCRNCGRPWGRCGWMKTPPARRRPVWLGSTSWSGGTAEAGLHVDVVREGAPGRCHRGSTSRRTASCRRR